jgi:hypothetical protein
VGFAGDRGLEVQLGSADRFARRGIADFLEEFEMSVRVTRFALCGGAKNGGDVVVPFDIRLLGKIKVTPVRLAFAGEGVLQVFCRLGAFQGHEQLLFCSHALGASPPASGETCAPGQRLSSRLELF